MRHTYTAYIYGIHIRHTYKAYTPEDDDVGELDARILYAGVDLRERERARARVRVRVRVCVCVCVCACV